MDTNKKREIDKLIQLESYMFFNRMLQVAKNDDFSGTYKYSWNFFLFKKNKIYKFSLIPSSGD